MKQRTIANRGKQENQGNMDSYVLFLWALKPFATRNTFWHLTLSFLHDLPFSRTRHGTHQGATTSESTHQIRLKWLGFCGPQKKKHWIWVRIWFGLGLPSRNAYAPYTASKLQVSIWFPYHFSPYHYWISNARLTSQKKMKGIRKNPDAWNLLGYISRLSPSSPKKTWTIWAPRHRLPRFCCTVTCR